MIVYTENRPLAGTHRRRRGRAYDDSRKRSGSAALAPMYDHKRVLGLLAIGSLQTDPLPSSIFC